MGIMPSSGVMKTLRPTVMKMSTWVTLCSLMPRKVGFSPGAALSDSMWRDFTWLMVRTVAATNQGMPRMEQMMMQTATINRSRW